MSRVLELTLRVMTLSRRCSLETGAAMKKVNEAVLSFSFSPYTVRCQLVLWIPQQAFFLRKGKNLSVYMDHYFCEIWCTWTIQVFVFSTFEHFFYLSLKGYTLYHVSRRWHYGTWPHLILLCSADVFSRIFRPLFTLTNPITTLSSILSVSTAHKE